MRAVLSAPRAGLRPGRDHSSGVSRVCRCPLGQVRRDQGRLEMGAHSWRLGQLERSLTAEELHKLLVRCMSSLVSGWQQTCRPRKDRNLSPKGVRGDGPRARHSRDVQAG